ncbi:MAG: hypothetical protein LBQ39_01695 [Tannerellaceae bacterium]|nr:hypothetical protein [Tannerellaceae bacterium]
MRYLSVFFLLVAGMCLLYGCLEDPDIPDGVVNAGKPQVDSLKLAGTPTATTIQVSAKIIKQNGSPVVEYGFRWYIDGSDSVDSLKIENGIKKDETFSRTIQGLKNNVSYSIQAYAKNEYGISYSDILHAVTIEGVGVVATLAPDIVTVRGTSAVCGGKIIHGGEGEILSYGIFYSQQEQMLEKDTVFAATINDDATFFCTLTGLKPLETYYIQAFVENEFGMFPSESPVRQFTTTSGDRASVRTHSIMLDMENGTITVNGEVTNQGETEVSAYGVSWGVAGNPVLFKDSIIVSSGMGAFTGVITELKGETVYHVRTFAVNGSGIGYGDTLTTVQTPRVLDTMSSFTGGYRIAGSCATFSIGNVGYLLGGDTGPQFTDKLWSYNASVNAWQELLSFPDGNFKWQTAVSYPPQKIVCVFGGVNSTLTSNKMYWYDAGKNEWDEKQVLNGPAAYHSGVGASFGMYVYFVGGRRDTITNEFWSYMPVFNYWERKANFPEKQYGGVAVAINDTIFAGLGVVNPDNGETTDKLWKTYGALDHWELETTTPSGKVKAGVAYKGSLYVIDDAGTIWRYNVSSRKWTEKMTLPANNRMIHCMYVLNNQIYIGLGENSSTLLRYRPAWDN